MCRGFGMILKRWFSPYLPSPPQVFNCLLEFLLLTFDLNPVTDAVNRARVGGSVEEFDECTIKFSESVRQLITDLTNSLIYRMSKEGFRLHELCLSRNRAVIDGKLSA